MAEDGNLRRFPGASSPPSAPSLSYNMHGYSGPQGPPFAAPFRREDDEDDFNPMFLDSQLPYSLGLDTEYENDLRLEALMFRDGVTALKRAPSRRPLPLKFIESSPGKEVTVPDDLRLNKGETLPSDKAYLAAAADSPGQQHLRLLLRQLMKDSGLAEEWEDVIHFMARKACVNVNPNVREGLVSPFSFFLHCGWRPSPDSFLLSPSGDGIDIRRYVKIKKIMGGTYSDSVYLQGAAATKNVAHKKMVHTFQNPRVLILKFALEYERTENKTLAFQSLDPVLNDEKSYLKMVIGKIAALQPHIVLVEKTVSQVAQDLLLDSDITLVKTVKPSVIEAVSRSTNAVILTSIGNPSRLPRYFISVSPQ